MQHLSLTKYAAYIQEKAGLSLLEWDNAWITYSIQGDQCFIADLWVDPCFRRMKLGSEITNAIVKLAKLYECNKLTSTIMVNSNGVEDTMKAQIAYGFKIVGSDTEKIYLSKEI